MKILLVDDDCQAGNIIKKVFIKHKITWADTEKEVLWLIKDNCYDVIIVDWNTGAEDGLRIGKSIKEVCNPPSLFLASKPDTDCIIRALDSGFDDYMTKPFSRKELYVRVKKLSHRKKETIFKETKIVIGELCIDFKRHIVRKGNENMLLTRSEYQILKCLVMEKETLIRREKLMAGFSNNNHASDHLLNMHIANLRKKLSDALNIITVPGKGYIVR